MQAAANLRVFQSLSGNSSVVGGNATLFRRMQVLSFQSLSGNSSVVGLLLTDNNLFSLRVSIPFREFKCCRFAQCGSERVDGGYRFQSLSGNSSVVGPPKPKPKVAFGQFQSLSGNSSVVGGFRLIKRHGFFLFQSLSGNSSVVGREISLVSNSRTSFQSLSGNSSVVGRFALPPLRSEDMFQSLSGNSSVVGCVLCHHTDQPHRFNPFQGIQVLSAKHTQNPIPFNNCFNPFQGIQVLSVWGRLFIQMLEKVSIPFREFKCCRVSVFLHPIRN